MYVAATTGCFPDLSLQEALQKLVDLEFTRVEIDLRESGHQIKPSQVLADLQTAAHTCSETHRLKPVAYFVDVEAEGDAYYEQFAACCQLAKLTKVVTITVPAAELGTPFNAEVERLRELVRIGSVEGVLVSVKTEVGCVTEDPATAVVLCDNVKGLGVTLDPSHFICGPHAGGSYDSVMKYVHHVRLRDSSKDQLQVRVGQGEIEYGRLISQLGMVNYRRALSVDMVEMEGVDHMAEMRKMRLLLESLL